MTPTDDKPMTVDALTDLAQQLALAHFNPSLTSTTLDEYRRSFRAAIEQYGQEREASATRKPIEGDWRTGAINYLRAVADGRRIEHANVPHLLAHVDTIDRLVMELEIMQNASPYGLDCVPAPPFDPAVEPPWHRSDIGPAGRGSGET